MKLISAVFNKNSTGGEIKDKEAIANIFFVKCVLYTFLGYTIVWLLDLVNIFIVDRDIVNKGYFICAAIVAMLLLFCAIVDCSQKNIQYIIMTAYVAIITAMGITLTYHAVLTGVLPLLCAIMYTSKRMMLYTYVLTVISTIIIVFVGYYHGLCDANMVLLTCKKLSDYIAQDGTFLLREIQRKPAVNLFLFYVCPRILIYTVFYPLCNNIVLIITSARNEADEMEAMAAVDEMTGLYGKSKYLRMVPTDFLWEKQVAVIFWDANGLKHVNDTMGHEKGDRLIISISECIKIISNKEKAPAFRIGGDEFVMIIRGGTPEIVQEKLELFQNYRNLKSRQEQMALSVSIGYACGSGKDIEQIIKEADERMYIEKKEYHAAEHRN